MARDRYDHSDVITPVRPRRMEVLSGPERRRKWSDEAKIVIVAEALADGVVVSDVARRHDILPSQLFGWMRQFRDAALATIAPPPSPMFTPAVVDVPVAMPLPAPPPPAKSPAEIEISVGVATVRIRGAVDAKTLTAVLKALRALA
jgi:transposase